MVINLEKFFEELADIRTKIKAGDLDDKTTQELKDRAFELIKSDQFGTLLSLSPIYMVFHK